MSSSLTRAVASNTPNKTVWNDFIAMTELDKTFNYTLLPTVDQWGLCSRSSHKFHSRRRLSKKFCFLRGADVVQIVLQSRYSPASCLLYCKWAHTIILCANNFVQNYKDVSTLSILMMDLNGTQIGTDKACAQISERMEVDAINIVITILHLIRFEPNFSEIFALCGWMVRKNFDETHSFCYKFPFLLQ